jgi:hypothetical protein
MPRVRHRTTAFLIAGTTAASLLATAGPAAAKPVLRVAYKVTGTSTIAKTGSAVTLGPTTLTTALNRNGAFTASMPLPPTSTTFAALGLLPVAATVTFTQVGRITGRLTAHPRPAVSAASSYTIGLSDVTVAGIPTPVGTSCATKQPVVLDVASPSGSPFNVTKGGVLAGTYTITPFAHCGPTTSLINLLVPGPGNTVSLRLRHGHLVT